MTMFETLKQTGLPVAHNAFDRAPAFPCLVYTGTGQEAFEADNTFYVRQNTYRIEYYFKYKDEDAETAFEDFLLGQNIKYVKSEDTYIDNDQVFVIYYEI